MRNRILAVAAAVGAAVVLWVLARLLDVDLVVDQGRGPDRIGLPLAAGVAFAVSMAGWGVRAGLDRVARRSAAIWAGSAGLVLVVSLLPVLTVGASGGTRAVLAAMHLAVAAALIPVFGRSVNGTELRSTVVG
ncbi:DUF6069 family protein [Virgisporangium aurantiacum]|uniref:Uncharacterized protein n=1 Tax=Virgisporangium aurantiacum TaxID=175570 RepID=A0A8J4DXS5_9ACTN|nr:DUF6069 family protein [Virgisporangium aurantiacum]GIJ54865.1 hypothetical protein Vau01_023810 [Virgisporangium aurantiacum]